MGKCELIGECPFYKGTQEGEGSIEALKESYCHNNNLHCAIYMLASSLSMDKVPSDLYPDQKEKVYLILAENS